MKIIYRWKVLSEDGLLKDHKPLGYYDQDESLSYGYTSREEAVTAYNEAFNLYGWEMARDLVLIKLYRGEYNNG